jgi:hypothetical protein
LDEASDGQICGSPEQKHLKRKYSKMEVHQKQTDELIFFINKSVFFYTALKEENCQ